MKDQVIFRYIPVTLLALVISLLAMSKSKEVPFLRDGVSFSVAPGWKVTANDSIGDNAYYFSTERTGNGSTGLITIDWVNKVDDPLKVIHLHQKSMKSANIYRNPGIEFTLVDSCNFAGHKVKTCKYITFVREQKIEGTIYCLNAAQKTITIFFQTGLADKKLNLKGFELFQQTFNCRE